MGIVITVKVDNTELSQKLDLAEDELLETAAQQTPEAKTAYLSVFGDNVDGVTRHVACKDFLRAVDVLLGVRQGTNEHFVYSVVVPAGYVTSGVGSGVGGLRVGDTTYAVLGGFDHCMLITAKKNAQGEWVKVAEEDAKELKLLKTDNMGVVKIRKRAVPNRLIQFLKRIRKRLSQLRPDALIETIVG